MKRYKYLTLLAVGLFLTHCDNDNTQIYTLDNWFEVEEGHAVTITWGEEGKWINLMVIDIEDSRCPSDAACVRAGNADVMLGVNGVQEILKTLDMCVGECDPPINEVDTAQVELDGEDYAVLLKDVTPYPTTTNQDQAKKAVMKVIRWD